MRMIVTERQVANISRADYSIERLRTAAFIANLRATISCSLHLLAPPDRR